ncbi:DUF7448 domain-containing protein [Cupriavidus gilardii]|uniref:DUF7448 domain-containing protein n=1 Tax=Cupriavidus gilardii TaxID=82541 RepID=UPI0021BE7478|nr:hypothetical protein [Cupriavidus gilardii]MCT9125379.1 hypothetical protein [Cupriavidus gilardii]
MINMIGGNGDAVEVLKASIGKTIKMVTLEQDDALHFEFTDGSKIAMFDDGQSCCERRYMTTDDDLSSFAGSTFLGAEIKEAPSIEDEWGEHEVQFLEIQTSSGSFTMASHNEHNGYYGGFSITVRAEQ